MHDFMEQKEYPVPVFSGGGDSLEIVDSDGNPFQHDNPVNYRIIGDDGEVLKEGTLDEGNVIPLSGVEARSFRLVLEGYFVAEIEGIESPAEEETTNDPITSPGEDEGPLERDDLTSFEEEGSFDDNAVYADEKESADRADDDSESAAESDETDNKSDGSTEAVEESEGSEIDQGGDESEEDGEGEAANSSEEEQNDNHGDADDNPDQGEESEQ